MTVLHALLWLLSGAIAVNIVPHLANGLSGNRFPTPFAKPFGRGLSSPLANVLWAWCNGALLGLALYWNLPSFDLPNGALMVGGGFLMSIRLSLNFAKKHRE